MRGFLLLMWLWPRMVLAVDLGSLWDFGNPALSEQRFRAALPQATGDDELILLTQIARTQGLRRNFASARTLLEEIEPRIRKAGAEARTRYQLELGRCYASAKHDPSQLTPEAKARARNAFHDAWLSARSAGLDALAIDAIHMFAFLDTSPGDQLKWGLAALDVVQATSQPEARRWEASVRQNVGYALHQLGRHDEALTQFRQVARLREQGKDPQAIRVARWLIARTLRSQGRIEDALDMQLRLERENATAGKPDPHVFSELAILYDTKGNAVQADHYRRLMLDAEKR